MKEKIAYIDTKGFYTYFDLFEKVSMLNDYFVFHNIKKIAIYMEKSFSAYSLILAAYLSKVTFSVWNTYLPRNRIDYYYDVFKPDMVFIENKVYSIFSNCLLVEQVFVNSFSSTRDFIVRDDNELAYVLFTSGSTNLPKGCKISYYSLDLLIEKSTVEMNVNENDVYGQYAPFYFDMSILDIFIVPYVGATLVAFSTFSERLRPGNIIYNNQITFINSVPQMYDILERGKQFGVEILASLKQIKIGGDIVKKRLLDKIFDILPKINVYVTYGPTETTVFCMIVKLNKENYTKFCDKYKVSLGEAIDGYSIIKLTKEKEIMISGPCVGLGYMSGDNDNFITENNQVFYLSGDFAEIKNGMLFFVGRKDEQAKINGNRINIVEIETVLFQHDVESAAIVVGSQIILFYVSKKHKEDRIRDILNNEIPSYEIPSLIIRLKRLKYNANGKVDKVYLKSYYKNIGGNK